MELEMPVSRTLVLSCFAKGFRVPVPRSKAPAPGAAILDSGCPYRNILKDSKGDSFIHPG
jgi:hypothetical protein